MMSTTLLTASRVASRAVRTTTTTVTPSAVAIRSFSSLNDASQPRKSLVTGEDGVHQTMKVSKSWRNKPLFRRQGDVRFKTGMEAANLLVKEAMRRDSHELEYITTVTSALQCLSPIFDRNPKYAFVAKTLIEPERFIQFRVAWIDDMGVNRMNRGFRVQYSSALGPYKGSLHFGSKMNCSLVKALGFDSIFSNAVTGFAHGAAAGGSDFNPLDKSESEMMRFCQSYMTELAKYVGPDQDLPWMGTGVGEQEMGYLFGQYKRINMKIGTSDGRLLLSGDFAEVRNSFSNNCRMDIPNAKDSDHRHIRIHGLTLMAACLFCLKWHFDFSSECRPPRLLDTVSFILPMK
jgi:glutamate dehydrogenase (NADP+)